ncbi:hypothetical protein LLE49_16175 [Alicyclobacillus tolerans]|uniref:hypothetical protein n=1 Tax=Alicyclobacillus tolerans TaxID=90970 RepID=UPI001F45C4E1|nr:hypothetical protein [Alicyclobacillus tolerans]MCF8566260.1 hypothetical protein [Alicyclobacillus tolerans]
MDVSEERLSVTVYVIFLSLLFLMAAFCFEVRALPLVVTGQVQRPAVLGFVHLVVVGFVLQMMFGVLIKIVPIAFSGTLHSRPLALVHPPLLALGAAGLATGFFSSRVSLVIAGGILIVLAAAAVLYNLMRTFATLRKPTAVVFGVQNALFYIAVALLLGLTMALNFRWTFIPDLNTFIQLHIEVALFAGFTLLVSSISYKLLPMFLLAIKPKIHPYANYSFLNAGILLAAAALLIHSPSMSTIAKWLAAAMWVIGFAVHVYDAFVIAKSRHRKTIAIPIYAVLSAYSVWVGASVALALLWAGQRLTRASAGFGFFTLVMAGLVPMILGYLLKMIPFMWFQYRYSHAPDRRSAPPLNLLVKEVQGVWAIAGYGAGVAASLAGAVGGLIGTAASNGAWTDSSTVIAIGVVLQFCSVAYLTYLLTLVPRKHPKRPSVSPWEFQSPPSNEPSKEP